MIDSCNKVGSLNYWDVVKYSSFKRGTQALLVTFKRCHRWVANKKTVRPEPSSRQKMRLVAVDPACIQGTASTVNYCSFVSFSPFGPTCSSRRLLPFVTSAS